MYQGHSSKPAWQVSLWVNNDEGLYNMAKSYCRRYNRRQAAKAMLNDLNDSGVTHTPDGARYTVTSLREAMEGM